MKYLNSESGFTFLEVIVAVTILSFIILTLYSLLHTGFSFMDYIDNSRWSYNDLQLVKNKMAKDFHSAFYRSGVNRYNFKGTMYQAHFYTRTLESGQLKEIKYEYSSYDRALFLIKGDKRIPLIEEIKQCNFYFYNSQYKYWDNYWDTGLEETTTLPSMARIEFTFIDSGEKYTFDLPIYTGRKGISTK